MKVLYFKCKSCGKERQYSDSECLRNIMAETYTILGFNLIFSGDKVVSSGCSWCLGLAKDRPEDYHKQYRCEGRKELEEVPVVNFPLDDGNGGGFW